MGLSIFRIIFIILFLACNVNMDSPALPTPSHNTSTNLPLLQKRLPQAPLVNSDFVFLVLLALFGVSNGWLTSLIMMAAPSLEHNKRMRKEWVDTAAVGASFRYTVFRYLFTTLLTRFSLAAGLVFGSIANFAIRGMVCSCNPFIQ
jgi:solute carrier family 29 (equilibrative nucleoside transporter), member 1/2/3